MTNFKPLLMITKKPKPEKKKRPQIDDFPTPSDLSELPWVLFGILLIILYACASGCVSFERESMDEPEWKPKTYAFDSVEGNKCVFIGNEVTDLIDVSDDDITHDHVLIRVDEFKALMFKLQRCEAWR